MLGLVSSLRAPKALEDSFVFLLKFQEVKVSDTFFVSLFCFFFIVFVLTNRDSLNDTEADYY